MTNKVLSWFKIIIGCVLACASAFPFPRQDEGYAPIPVYGQPAPAYVAEPGPVGRVKMQVGVFNFAHK